MATYSSRSSAASNLPPSSDAPAPAGRGGAPSSATPPASGPAPTASIPTSSSASSTGTGSTDDYTSRENVLASDVADTTVPFFIPAVAARGVDDVALYDEPLSTRDGFLLLRGRGGSASKLCMCNALAGSCRYLPAADFGASKPCTYVLVTGGHDDSSPPTDGVWILAVDVKQGGMTYQIFSSASGEWGPVKRPAEFGDGLEPAYLYSEPKDVVVYGCSVYWLGVSVAGPHGRPRTCAFAIDVRTERTWTTELLEKYAHTAFRRQKRE